MSMGKAIVKIGLHGEQRKTVFTVQAAEEGQSKGIVIALSAIPTPEKNSPVIVGLEPREAEKLSRAINEELKAL